MREAHPVRRVAIEEVLSADRTGGQVPALVLLELSQVHAAVTLHAVTHVTPQALAQAAQVAEGAVVDVPPGLIVKELADAAVVACHDGVAGPALSCSSRGTDTHSFIHSFVHSFIHSCMHAFIHSFDLKVLGPTMTHWTSNLNMCTASGLLGVLGSRSMHSSDIVTVIVSRFAYFDQLLALLFTICCPV